MENEEARDFTTPDPEVILQAQLFLGYFLERKSDFTSRYNGFNDPFSDKMQLIIDTCYDVKSDGFVLGRQVIRTEKVKASLTAGGLVFKDVELYVKHAFPGSKSMLKLYGQPLYDKAKASHLKLPVLLMQAYNMANDIRYKDKLIDKGASQALISSLQAASLAIDEAIQTQTTSKGDRGLTTIDRISNLNKLWAMMVMLSECAKKIYSKDTATLKLFLLYPDTPKKPPKK